MSTELLARLGAELDEHAPHLSILDAYYAGTQPLSYLSPEARDALGARIRQVSINVPRLVVSSLVERLRVVGFTRDGTPDPALWATWTGNDLDQRAALAHREALTLGQAFVIVWTGPDGRARITVESARQMAAERDPATGDVLGALKRWQHPDGGQVAVVYEPDRITRYRTTATGAPADAAVWRTDATIGNPLGVVPVVPMVNTERVLDTGGRSEFADVIPLTDALVKISTDLMVTSEFFARPRRWATGVEIPTDADGEPVNPFASDADRTWISEAPESKFGQFAATDLGAYQTAVRVVLQQIMAVTGLPAHYVGVTDQNPASADAIRSAEAALTARAEAKQSIFGQGWERVARLALAVETGTDPAGLDVRVGWADPATRSVAQDADAAVKLVQAGILPPSEALRRLGYTDDEITRIRTAKAAEALDTAALPALGPARGETR